MILPEGDVEHIFNFLRGMEGVEHVSYYRHETSHDAAFVFVDAGAEASQVADILKTFPASKLIFASHGKYLLEVPAESRRHSNAPDFGVLPFTCVRSTRSAPRAELVEVQA